MRAILHKHISKLICLWIASTKEYRIERLPQQYTVKQYGIDSKYTRSKVLLIWWFELITVSKRWNAKSIHLTLISCKKFRKGRKIVENWICYFLYIGQNHQYESWPTYRFIHKFEIKFLIFIRVKWLESKDEMPKRPFNRKVIRMQP